MAYPRSTKAWGFGVVSAPLPYGVRTRMAGARARSDARKTLAERRTPSRIATGTLRYFTMGFCAATAAAAPNPRMRYSEAGSRYSFRTEGPKLVFRLAPRDGAPLCAGPPVGRLSGPPLESMLAEPYGGAASRAPPVPPRFARRHPPGTAPI